MFGAAEVHTIGERALLDVAKKLISRPYCATYAYETVTYSTTEEFERFMDYIEASSESEKSYLSTLIYPIFVYIYLELLRNEGDLEAQEFHTEYVDIFCDSEGYDEHLEALKSLTSVNDVENHAYFKKFWDMKYIVSIPEDIMKKLSEFLERTHSTSLVHLLHFYFHNEIIKLSAYCSGTCSEALEPVPEVLPSTSKTERRSGKRRSRLKLPPLCFTVFDLEKEEFTAVDINKDETQIAFAFYDSQICLKNLGSTLNESDEVYKLIRYEVSDFDTSLCYKDVGIYALKYLPFQSHQLLAAAYCTVILLNTETFEVIQEFESVHQAHIWKIDINLAGTLFATASEDCTSCVFSLAPGKEGCIRRFTGHTEAINVVKFHPNGMYVATGSSDNNIRLHHVEDSRTVRSFFCEDCEVFSLCFTPDGKYIISGGSDGYLRIFDITTNSLTCTTGSSISMKFDILLGKVTNLCYDDDGKVLVSSSSKGVARIWRMSGYENSSLQLLDQKFFSSKPNLLYYEGRNKMFRLILMVDREEVNERKRPCFSHEVSSYEKDETSRDDTTSETSEED